MTTFAHQLTFAETLRRIQAGEPVYTLANGLLELSEPKQTGARWMLDVSAALSGHYPAADRPPEVVIAEFEKALPLLPEIVKTIELVPTAKLTNPPRFTWSYTALQEFLTCPYQWAQKRYYKTVKEEPSKEMLWGQDAHKALELALKANTDQLPDRFAGLGWNKYLTPLVAARNTGATVMAEQQLALDRNLKPCSWFGKDAWGRGVLDFGVLRANKLLIGDWKTGKVKDDPLQLKIFCAFGAQAYPDVEEFNARFIWLKEPDPKKAIAGLPAPIKKADIPAIWEEILGHVRRMEIAWESENFRQQSNGLCRSCCPAVSCPHNGRR